MEKTLMSAIHTLEKEVADTQKRIDMMISNGSSSYDTQHLKVKIRRCRCQLNELKFQNANS
ncbi:hypothetical protein KMW28_22260 [Flammeovirga yaeyamensis]|uniref:Uncharacterized protein n=1 Tax=Flammeovirga yaeyamensis TaxID=367791 RepID=A0AAX1NDS4_9BACT|nr:hypothetical protein [Flammeovirga yaeyamensis]MBB3696918.1 hypothetical protein [Flammeovirga yaeyamensis]NMF33581.1 hypothetical protein [Flammeovirga yaeyamensis]QWG05151.1 hypothetical protein KMW28_22260 [Flammeovirga yaeyamensis]